VLVSDPKGRDIKIDSYTLSFHGRLLIEGAEIALNYGQRYGLLGENGSGKVRPERLVLRCSDDNLHSLLSFNPLRSKTLLSRITSMSILSAAKLSLPT